MGEIPAWNVELHLPPHEALYLGYRWQVTTNMLNDKQRATQLDARFRDHYRKLLEQAMTRDTAALLSARGFHAVPAAPGLAAPGKAQANPPMLVSVPTATLSFLRTVDQENCDDHGCLQHGQIKLAGQVVYQLVEPVSGVTVAVNRMNVWGMGVGAPYVLETSNQEPGLWTRTQRWLGLAPAPKDTREDAMVASLNQFYAHTMHNIDLMVGYRQLHNFATNLDAAGGRGE
ncbi:MAG: hypothetical protein L0H83_08965 [Salinisphaera sp.]|nr:hypothetical protein [Salinisphaera sp.]